jgi:hypothetical protein
MPILSDRNRRFGFLVGRQSGLRSTDEMVEQLTARIRQLEGQLQNERSRQVARSDREKEFARAPSPSTMMH